MSAKVTYVAREELLALHDRLIRQYGGTPGVRDEGLLDSCLAQPKMFVFGKERYPELIEKAAAYCFYIVRNHPFFDGNKRAAFITALHFLRINNVKAWFDEDDAYDVIIGVAKDEVALDGVANMIASAVERSGFMPRNETSNE